MTRRNSHGCAGPLALAEGRNSPAAGARWFVLLALAVGCTGTIKSGPGETLGAGAPAGSPGTAASSSSSGAAQSPSVDTNSSVVRRLTRTEYNNTVRDLLGDDSNPASDFPVEETALGFDNNGAALTVPPLLAERYLTTAEKLSARALTNLDRLLPCAKTSANEACALTFIQDLGSRAWRRPLADEDVQGLLAAYRAGAAQGGFQVGIDLVLRQLLVSSNFLFRFEFGSGESTGPGLVKLNSWEVASRLSYFLWQTLPDSALIEAARAGRLSDPAQVVEQAQRLLADPRAEPALSNFNEQWMQLRPLNTALSKDATLFPTWRPEIQALMKQELNLLMTDIVGKSADPFRDLFSANYTFVNGPLAAYYGISGPSGDAFQRVTLEPNQAAGVLSRGALLIVHSHANQGSPTKRGKLIQDRFLCAALPPPPPTANATPPAPSPNLTTRQRLTQHATDPACAACHFRMDPIGFAFENFDAAGHYRIDENQVPIDASGTITVDGTEQHFVGVPALGGVLAESAQARNCLARQWFRYALGKAEQGAADEQAIGDLAALLVDGGGVKQMLLAIVKTPAFLARPAAALAVKP